MLIFLALAVCLPFRIIHKIHEVADPTAAFVIRQLLQGAANLIPTLHSRATIKKYILYLLVRPVPNVTDCCYHNMLIPAMYLRTNLFLLLLLLLLLGYIRRTLDGPQ